MTETTTPGQAPRPSTPSRNSLPEQLELVDLQKKGNQNTNNRGATDTFSVSSQSSGTELENVQQAKAADDEAEPDYPKGLKLASITFALCISVLLMALVSKSPFSIYRHILTCLSG